MTNNFRENHPTQSSDTDVFPELCCVVKEHLVEQLWGFTSTKLAFLDPTTPQMQHFFFHFYSALLIKFSFYIIKGHSLTAGPTAAEFLLKDKYSAHFQIFIFHPGL